VAFAEFIFYCTEEPVMPLFLGGLIVGFEFKVIMFYLLPV